MAVIETKKSLLDFTDLVCYGRNVDQCYSTKKSIFGTIDGKIVANDDECWHALDELTEHNVYVTVRSPAIKHPHAFLNTYVTPLRIISEQPQNLYAKAVLLLHGNAVYTPECWETDASDIFKVLRNLK